MYLKELIEEFMHPSYVTTFSRSKVCLKPAEAMADILGSLEDDTTPCDGCAEKDGRLLPPFLVVRDVGKGMLLYPKLAILFPETWARLGVFFIPFFFPIFLSPKSLRKVDFPITDTWIAWHMFHRHSFPKNLRANLDEAVESPKFSGSLELPTLKISTREQR